MGIVHSNPPEGHRVYDPVFIIMIVAVILAVASSVTLRLSVGGIGPKSAQAAEDSDFDHIKGPVHKSAVHHLP